jgi:UDP-hydrolysing UDP-N-acetyl-D-glucosamine 2-epimerase
VRTIAVVTVGRSDYGIYRPILKRIAADAELRLTLIVSGSHLSPEFGATVSAIEKDGYPIAERVEMLLSSDSPVGVVQSMGLGVMGFGQAYARLQPDLLLVLGDRFEMHAAALAALPLGLPVAHVHGGELSQGAIDDALRHSMTKLAHLHFVSTEEYARRVRQLGEEPWRVTVSGAPGLDNLESTTPVSAAELHGRWGVPMDPAPLLVTFHPVTLEPGQAEWQVEELLAALSESGRPLVFTASNADHGGRAIAQRIRAFVGSRPTAALVENAGTDAYFGLMAAAAAMVGNSSSGIVEAASFALPVVNVGARQEGRLRPPNVIDVGNFRADILAGLQKALAPAFREGLRGLVNPYGTGQASKAIVDRLKAVPIDDRLRRKRFYDIEEARKG